MRFLIVDTLNTGFIKSTKLNPRKNETEQQFVTRILGEEFTFVGEVSKGVWKVTARYLVQNRAGAPLDKGWRTRRRKELVSIFGWTQTALPLPTSKPAKKVVVKKTTAKKSVVKKTAVKKSK